MHITDAESIVMAQQTFICQLKSCVYSTKFFSLKLGIRKLNIYAKNIYNKKRGGDFSALISNLKA